MSSFDLECLIKKLTYFQSSNPTCIDLILTNLKNKSITEYFHFQTAFLQILHKILLRSNKKNYFQKLNIKDLTDDEKFYKTVKAFFSNKGLNSNKLMLREKDVVVAVEKVLATLMNNYFVNVTADLDLKRDSENFYDTPASVYNIKKKCQDHQSVLKIKKALNVTDLFSFHGITEDEIRKEISKLDGSEATPV